MYKYIASQIQKNKKNVGSEVFIMGYSDIKLDRDIRLGMRFETHIEMNIIDIKKAKITWKIKNCFGINDLDVIQTRVQRQETQTFKTRDPLMSNLNNILDHGSTKLALFKFANAHSMNFLGMVLILRSMIFDQVAKTTASTLTHSGAWFSTTDFADQQLRYFNVRSVFALLAFQN